MFYSPLYHGMWSDEALEGAPFEEKGFFAFLWSHERIRPSGIYRVTDAQLAVDTGLPMKRVREYLADLHHRLRIVRDGAWIFVRGFFARQPKHKFLLAGVERDLWECGSIPVLEAFIEKYPLQKAIAIKSLTNRREQRSATRRAIDEEKSREDETKKTTTLPPRPPAGEEPSWPSPEALVQLYNRLAPDECPEVTKLSPGRRKKAGEYLRIFPDRKFWEETCAQIRASRFLRGLRPSNGHERFVADFDWLLTKGKDGSENCLKTYEGRYHD